MPASVQVVEQVLSGVDKLSHENFGSRAIHIIRAVDVIIWL